MKIGFIGFGEAARAFRESLAAVDPTLEFAAFDILLDSEGGDGQCAATMRAADVEIAIPADGLATADWIVSAVTADQSLLAAEAAAGWLRAGQVYFDINSVSPERKRRSADIVGNWSKVGPPKKLITASSSSGPLNPGGGAGCS